MRCGIKGGSSGVLNAEVSFVILRFSVKIPEDECMEPPSFRFSSEINGPGPGVLGEASENKWFSVLLDLSGRIVKSFLASSSHWLRTSTTISGKLLGSLAFKCFHNTCSDYYSL